jgi:hypothetical protein
MGGWVDGWIDGCVVVCVKEIKVFIANSRDISVYHCTAIKNSIK